jgi:hypothetical protein
VIGFALERERNYSPLVPKYFGVENAKNRDQNDDLKLAQSEARLIIIRVVTSIASLKNP